MTDDEYIREATGTLIKRVAFEKARRYVDDPSDAPDDVDVEEGPRGGYFYETGGSLDAGDGDDVSDSVQDIQDNFSQDDWVTLETENAGPIRGTIDSVTSSSVTIEDEDGQKRGIPAEDIRDVSVSEEDRMRNQIMGLDEGEPVTVDTENVGEISGTVINTPGSGSALRIMGDDGQERGIPVDDISNVESGMP